MVNGTEKEEAEEAHEGGHAHGGIVDLDQDDSKDVYARIAYTLPNKMNTIGVLAYRGRTELAFDLGEEADHEQGAHEDEHGAAKVVRGARLRQVPLATFDDDFLIVGGDVELNFGPANARAVIAFGDHDNPHASGVDAQYTGAMGELAYAFSPKWLGVVRYDQVVSDDLPALERKTLTPYVTVLPLDNLKLNAEYFSDFDDHDRDQAFFHIDVGF